MKVSDYVLKRLAAEGIDTAFEVYGGAMSELMDAFTRQDAMRYIAAQHEQGAVFMAEGWAKAKGKPGLVIVTSGPGGGNIVTGLQNAYYDSVPLIAITGQVQSQFMRPAGSPLRQLGFQETPIVDIVKPITKYAVTVQGPMHLAYSLETAILGATKGRAGPVLIDIPSDVQKAEMPQQFVATNWHEASAWPAKEAGHFMGDLAEAARPGILVGGGAYGAREAIAEFAIKHSIPVFRTWNGLDVMPDDCYAYGGTVGTYGGPGRNFGLQNCDLLLVLGCRISGRITGGRPESFARGAKKYIVDVDPGLLEPKWQQVKGDVNVLSDAGAFVRACISGRYAEWTLQFKSWLDMVKLWLAKYDPVRPEMLTGEFHHYGFMRKLSEMIPDNAIIVSDTGGNVIMMGHCFKTKRGQRVFTSNGNTPMGFALCGALGAWFAEPHRPVICIIGDGGMSMNIQELQTLVHYGAKVNVFIINNHILGNTKGYQRVNGKPEIACGPDGYSCPDFCKVAEAYGVTAFRIQGWEGVDLVKNLLAEDMAAVFDVVHHDFCTYEPRISRFDLPIEDMAPFLPREEFRSNMLIEPSEGWEGVN